MRTHTRTASLARGIRSPSPQTGRTGVDAEIADAARAALTQAMSGLDVVLDIGHRGTFLYDPRDVRRIVCLDPLLGDLPESYVPPANVELRAGSPIAIPFPDNCFFGVVMVHATRQFRAETRFEAIRNLSLALREAVRVLRPSGRLIVLEDCLTRDAGNAFPAVGVLAGPCAGRDERVTNAVDAATPSATPIPLHLGGDLVAKCLLRRGLNVSVAVIEAACDTPPRWALGNPAPLGLHLFTGRKPA